MKHTRIADEALRRLGETAGEDPVLTDLYQELTGSFSLLNATIRDLLQTQEELVTARVRADLEQRYYRALFQDSPDGYLVTDAVGAILEANRAASVMLGVKAPFLEGKPLIGFLDRELRGAFRALIGSMRNGDPREIFEWDLKRREDRTLKVSVSTSIDRDENGKVMTIHWLLRDVTQQELTRDRLRNLGRQNELLLSSVGEGIFGVDRTGMATFINPAAERILGWPQEEFIGRGIEELLQPLSGRSASRDPSRITASLHDGMVRSSDADSFERRDGSRFPVEYICTPIIEGGETVGIVVAFRDITSRRESQERIRMLNRELEQRVAERTAELEIANRQKDQLLQLERLAREEAERANGAKDDFMAIVSHELRTPLTTIKTFTDLLLRSRVAEADRIDYLSVISNECDRQISLVQNILDISFIESRGFSLSFESIELDGLIQSCLAPTRRAAVAAGQSLFIDIPGDLPPVRGDSFALRRMITNLLENAVKYTPEHGAIHLTARTARDHVEISVRDTGCGIAMDDLSKIFGKFYRAGDDTARRNVDNANGVGLGLYLVRLLADRIGARIDVESQIGQGSTFTLQLAFWETSNGHNLRG